MVSFSKDRKSGKENLSIVFACYAVNNITIWSDQHKSNKAFEINDNILILFLSYNLCMMSSPTYYAYLVSCYSI